VYATPQERQNIETAAAEFGVPFRGLWLTADPQRMAARVASRHNDASDATPEVVRTQLGWDIGALSPGWISIDADGSVETTLRHASVATGIDITNLERERP